MTMGRSGDVGSAHDRILKTSHWHPSLRLGKKRGREERNPRACDGCQGWALLWRALHQLRCAANRGSETRPSVMIPNAGSDYLTPAYTNHDGLMVLWGLRGRLCTEAGKRTLSLCSFIFISAHEREYGREEEKKSRRQKRRELTASQCIWNVSARHPRDHWQCQNQCQ